jgi:topoisomerase-4 subunit B
MGDKVEPRRKWIESHVQFSLEEEGSILEKKEDEPEIEVQSIQDVQELSLFDD